MMGQRTGLATRFKQVCPFALAHHCVAHKLALACSDFMKEEPKLVEFDTIIQKLSTYIHGSPLRQALLTEIQAELNEPELAILALHK